MATGHSESYVRLWSLKGEKLRGMRSDFQASSVKDSERHELPADDCADVVQSLGCASFRRKAAALRAS